jgi:aryl-alcohol dehydrogenase-like predicted oxidoreductase
MAASRRDFLKVTAAGTLALTGMASCGARGEGEAVSVVTEAKRGEDPVPEFTTPESTKRGDMLYRILGRTGEKVSLVGMGGFHLGAVKPDDAAVKLCRRAIDSGINFMDNSWDYNHGRSEEVMGKALRDGYRKKVFLMTKLDGRTKESASKQLEESLKRLETDVIDLVQIHEVIRLEDPDRCFAKGGAIEAFVEAKKAGKIRYIGFTGHKDPMVHLRMLETAASHGFRFDTVQMPLNVMDAHFRSFAHQVLPVLVKEGIGVLGMKSMGSGVILKSQAATAMECLHYAMSLPTSVVITGMDGEKILDQALEAVKTFRPLAKGEMAGLLAKTRPDAAEGRFELFKTSDTFDSTAKNPQWLGKAG